MDIVGDSIICLWLADHSATNACRNACNAALALHQAMNQAPPGDITALPTRFGLHYGPVFLGEVGADARRELRVVGDIVYTSSRIQSLNKNLGTRILASGAVLEPLADSPGQGCMRATSRRCRTPPRFERKWRGRMNLARYLEAPVGALAIVLSLIAPILVIGFLIRAPELTPGRKLLLSLALFVLPTMASMSGNAHNIETTKKVEFCGSCHVMTSYVEDVRAPESDSLASLHGRLPIFKEEACYTCRADYGMFGGVTTKNGGLHHVIDFYSDDWSAPGHRAPKLYKPYDPRRCLNCHAPVREGAPLEHRVHAEKIEKMEVSCSAAGCHGPPHPPDIHWPSGAFGYFPTYTMGAIAASQIFAAAVKSDPAITAGLGDGKFGALFAFLRPTVHALGASVTVDELLPRRSRAPRSTSRCSWRICGRGISTTRPDRYGRAPRDGQTDRRSRPSGPPPWMSCRRCSPSLA